METIIELAVLFLILAVLCVSIIWTIKLANRIPEVKDSTLDFSSALFHSWYH